LIDDIFSELDVIDGNMVRMLDKGNQVIFTMTDVRLIDGFGMDASKGINIIDAERYRIL
jgi:recombinational DNA repair ATPase RecF